MNSENLSSRNIAVWFGLALLLAVVVILVVSFAGSPGEPGQIDEIVSTVLPSDHIKGNATSTVMLLEYSDFQCPACAVYSPVVGQLVNEYANKIKFVYRHFPLNYHLNAEKAAWAAEAAGKQGKFWEMHDVLFEKQKEWEKSSDAAKTFEDYAKNLNLDLVKFKADMNSALVKLKVEDDYASGLKVGVGGTPSFYLNGKSISPQSYQQFKSLLDAEINKTQ